MQLLLGGGSQSCQAQRESERSKLHECMQIFLLTSLAFPYIKKFIIVPVLKFLVHMEEKKSQQWLTSFFIYFTDTKSERMQSCLKVCLTLGCPNRTVFIQLCFNWLLDPSSVRTLAICQCLPEPPPCLLNILLHVQSDLGLDFSGMSL